MVQENPVHLRLGYGESVEFKKDLLSSEMFLLNMLKTIKKYDAIRTNELKMKDQLYKLVKDLGISVRKTKSSFPFLKIPENVKREKIKEKEAEPLKPQETPDETLESQLRDIQERLNAIGR